MVTRLQLESHRKRTGSSRDLEAISRVYLSVDVWFQPSAEQSETAGSHRRVRLYIFLHCKQQQLHMAEACVLFLKWKPGFSSLVCLVTGPFSSKEWF